MPTPATDSSIRALKATDKIYEKTLAGTPRGVTLLISVYPVGRKTIFLRWSDKGRKSKRQELGDWGKSFNASDAMAIAGRVKAWLLEGRDPAVELDIARRRQQRIAELCRSGLDRPVAEKAVDTEEEGDLSVREAVRQYIEDHCRRPRELPDGTMRPWLVNHRAYERFFHRFVLPPYGSMAITSVDRRMCRAIIKEARLAAQKNRGRAGKGGAQGAHTMLSSWLTWADKVGLREGSPLRGVGFEDSRCQRSYDYDWPDFVRIVQRLQKEGTKDHGAAVLLLICYVWVRSETGRTIERHEIDDDGWWTIPPSKIKGARLHRLPLDHRLTKELLASRPAMGPLFPSRSSRRRADGFLAGLNWPIQQHLPDGMTAHGLRHVGASLCEGIGVPKGDISYVLHHKSDSSAPSITTTYLKSHSDPIVYRTVHRWLDAVEIALKMGDKANAAEIAEQLARQEHRRP